MNVSKAVFLALALTLSPSAFAEGGADRVFTRMMDAQQAAQSKKAEPRLAGTSAEKKMKTARLAASEAAYPMLTEM